MPDDEVRPDLGRFPFVYDGVMREVLVTPNEHDRGIVIMHELPGMSRETIELAEYLDEAEFQFYLPLLFGKPGQSSIARGLFPGGVQTMCVRAEFLGHARQERARIG